MRKNLLPLVTLLFSCASGTQIGDSGTPVDLAAAVDGTTGAPDGSADGGSRPPPTCAPPVSAPDTSKPTTVVGTGPGTCSEALLVAAVAKAGVITFDCGPGATILLSKPLLLRTDVNTVIDGGGQVTLDGGGATQILRFDHPDYRKNDVQLSLVGLRLVRGRVSGTDPYAPAPAPCSQGYYDGYGGALYVRDGVVLIIDCTFEDNRAEMLGPDVGGGAISLQGVKKATLIGSSFINNAGSNGGAIESLNSDFDVYDSVFTGNTATGSGANGDDPAKCSVVAKTSQHQVGSGGNGGAVSIDGGSDQGHTFCGVRFIGNHGGGGALGGAIFRTPDLARQATVIDRCLFDSNTDAMGGGGALYFHNSKLQIVGSTFHGNTATGCGAIQSDGTVIDFENDTFEGNQATGAGGVGGALCLFGVTGRVRNLTFANGRADGFGAAIFGNPTLTVDNTLFWNNTANNPGAPMQCQIMATGKGNLQFPRNHTQGAAPDAECAAGIAFADPLLGAIGDFGGPTPTMVPSTMSPALGIGQACPATDQRGNARPASGCTAGAVEGSK